MTRDRDSHSDISSWAWERLQREGTHTKTKLCIEIHKPWRTINLFEVTMYQRYHRHQRSLMTSTWKIPKDIHLHYKTSKFRSYVSYLDLLMNSRGFPFVIKPLHMLEFKEFLITRALISCSPAGISYNIPYIWTHSLRLKINVMDSSKYLCCIFLQ